MASSRRKILVFLTFCLVALPRCGHHHVAHNRKHSQSIAKRAKHPPGYGVGKAVGYFIWPFEGPINSPYGERNGRSHDGIDIGGDEGDAIVAAAEGEVVYSDKLGGYGNLIVLKHPNGFFTAYAHNEKNLVDNGDHVKQGQRIAKLGRTGNATGDHLHFEVRDDSGIYDPLDFLPARSYTAKK